MRCTRSVHLHAALERGELDIALMTNQPEFRSGELVRREPLVWVAGNNATPELRKPLPLAVLPQGSVYRQIALEALGAAGLQWSVRSVCDSIAGLQAAVFGGLAVSIFPQCAISDNVRCLSEIDGLPKLPPVDLVMHRKSYGNSGSRRTAEHHAETGNAPGAAEIEIVPMKKPTRERATRRSRSSRCSLRVAEATTGDHRNRDPSAHDRKHAQIDAEPERRHRHDGQDRRPLAERRDHESGRSDSERKVANTRKPMMNHGTILNGHASDRVRGRDDCRAAAARSANGDDQRTEHDHPHQFDQRADLRADHPAGTVAASTCGTA